MGQSGVRLPVNMREARIITDGSEELFGELVEIFLGFYENLVTGIAEAVESVDYEKARFLAHQLKGSLRNFAADKAVNAAALVEDITERRSSDALSEALRDLRMRVTELAAYFESGAWKDDFKQP